MYGFNMGLLVQTTKKKTLFKVIGFYIQGIKWYLYKIEKNGTISFNVFGEYQHYTKLNSTTTPLHYTKLKPKVTHFPID